MPEPSRDSFRTRLARLGTTATQGICPFRAHRGRRHEVLPPEYVRVHYPALCERYLSILPWTTSITAAAIYCPKTFVLAAAVAAADDRRGLSWATLPSSLSRPSYVIATSAWRKEGAARPTAHIKTLHRRPANCPPR
jgi:hypothetical protein